MDISQTFAHLMSCLFQDYSIQPRHAVGIVMTAKCSYMNQYEVPAVIADRLPEVDKDIRYLAVLGNVNQAMAILSGYTCKMIAAHQFRQVQKCMKLADAIYERGNTVVKNAVENIFIFSFSLMTLSCNRTEWRLLQAKIPLRLYTVYMKQVGGSAC